MASDLKTIVQHMIDAGESEENIATVIKGYKAPSDAAQFGDPSLHPTIGAVSDTPQEPTWKDNLGAMLKPLAQPTSASDIGHLILAPTDVTRGAIANIPTVVKAAGDVISGAKQQAGNLLMSVAHPTDTLDRIAKHLIGSDAPDPMELDAAKNELAAMRLRLQAARSVARQADTAKSLPVAADMQSQAGDMVDALHKATSKSGLLDATGKPVATSADIGDFGSKFVQSLKDQMSTGRKLSGAQYQILQRIYKTVFP